MMLRRFPLQFLMLLGLAWVWTSPAAQAGVLLEADWQGVSVRAETAADQSRVRLEVDGRAYLMDADAGVLYDLAGTEAFPHSNDGSSFGSSVLPFSLRQWSNGPPIAGHRTRYNVLQVEELVCGEVLDSGWMAPFMSSIVDALATVQRVDRRLAPIDRGACGAADFGVYARNGWPLVVGWRDAEIFRTHTLRFDHRPEAGLLQVPKRAVAASCEATNLTC